MSSEGGLAAGCVSMVVDVREVLLDPRCPVPYYTLVVDGLERLGIRWRWATLDGPTSVALRMLVDDRRVVVDAGDSATLAPGLAEWADVITKVNSTDRDVRLLGPLFGTRCWPLPLGYRHVASLTAAGKPVRAAIADIRFQGITRLPLAHYDELASRRPQGDFVFHRSREWPSRQDDANAPRRKFVAAAAATSGLQVDAGLSAGRVALTDYLAATARSAVVFNSPAVHGCLGWKLGEYLALGKAIISTPLHRELPAPLVHGEHVHYVEDDVDEMRAAIEQICADPDYRDRLGRGARAWFEEHLTPTSVVRRILTAD